MGILIGVFCVVIFMDWRYYRIPNACIFVGMSAGLILTYMSCSASGLLEAAGVAIIVFLAFYPFYLLGALGAGDIKLFMMVCCYRAYIQTDGLIHYMLVAMSIAAMISVTKMILYAESRERLFYMARYIRKTVLTGTVDIYRIDKTRKHCVVRLSIPAFLSLILMYTGVYS